MSTKVEKASSHIQATGTAASPASGSGPKISMFASKSGFVIPKNKLSGSLVPIYRGGKKEGDDIVDETSSKQVHRKTKWGPDLTQDTAVRKGRTLAYQTRVDQITQQLNSGTLGAQDNQDQLSDSESASYHHNSEKSKLLELERREAIGEILKLNPMYKAPADYKPLLKEAKVPIPIKEYPGFNFINMIFGTAKDTQKRLEKETGAKVRIYGRKADMRDEAEVTSFEGNETAGAYEELFVHVSADTYEKVDAAVALIELLVTPVSANAASGSTKSTTASSENSNAVDVSHNAPGSHSSFQNHGVAAPTVEAVAPRGHFEQYPRSWFPAGPDQTPVTPSSGYMVPPNPSAPVFNSPVQVSSVQFSNVPSLFGPRPVLAGGFSSMPHNPLLSLRPQLPPVMRGAYMPQAPGLPTNAPMKGLQSAPSQPSISTAPQFSFNQPVSTAPPQVVHQSIPSLHSSAPANILHSNLVSPISNPSTTPTKPLMSQVGMPLALANHIVRSPSTPLPVISSQPSPHSGIPSSLSGSSLNFNPIRPSFTAPRLQQPNLGDFTFQPQPQPHAQRPQQPTSQLFPQPASQHGHQNMVTTSQMMQQPQAPHLPFLRPAMSESNPPPVVQGFLRPQMNNQMGQPRFQMASNFSGSPAAPPGLLRHPTFPNTNPVSPAIGLHMRPRNFGPVPPLTNSAGRFPSRAGNHMQFQQNFSATAIQPQSTFSPNQKFNNNLPPRSGNPSSGSSGTQQVYDPFSPTSLTFNPKLSGDRVKAQNQESDPEYEDLMASVGVK